jgi:hypothetical protein
MLVETLIQNTLEMQGFREGQVGPYLIFKVFLSESQQNFRKSKKIRSTSRFSC